jgi:serine phosphatase RsbU (regulator of sigma subunit)
MKSIKLNSLICICIFVILLTSSLIYFLAFTYNINKLQTYAVKSESKNNQEFINAVFVSDIDKQAAFLNRAFVRASTFAKSIASDVERIINEKAISVNTEIKLKYDKNNKLYSYLDEDSIVSINGYDWGYICGWKTSEGSEDKPVPENIQTQINNLTSLEPTLAAICINPNSISALSAEINDIFLIYTRNVKKYFYKKNIKNLEGSIFSEYYGEESLNEPHWSKAYSAPIGNDLLLPYRLPILDSNNKSIGTVTVVLSLNWLKKQKFDDIVLINQESEHQIITMLVDEQSNIIYLPNELYNLLSIPRDLHFSKLKADSFYLLNTNLSTDPDIRNLFEKILEKDHTLLSINIKGENYLMSDKIISTNGWNIVVLAKTDKLYKKINEIKSKYEIAYRNMYSSFITIFVIILLLGLLVSLFIFRRLFVKPIEMLQNKFYLLGVGQFDLRIKNKSIIQEINEFAGSFNNLGVQLKDYTSNLEQKKAIETEMELAWSLQESVLPKITDKFKRKEYELYAKLIPATKMSGDFYDFFYINYETLAIILADVSGKGVPAAFFMSRSKTIIKEACLSTNKIDPAIILDKVNKNLYEDNEKCMFLTMYLLFYNIKTGKLIYSNAGHHEFIKIDKNGTTETGGVSRSTAIGIFDNSAYSNNEIQLEKNQIFAVYTDGIIEAPDKENKEFGTERTLKAFTDNYKKNLNELGDSIIEEVLEFQSGSKFDDITLVMLNRK